MKILHLLDEPWDSGITSYALQIARLLSQSQHQVVLGVMSQKKPAKLARAIGLSTAHIDTPLQLISLLKKEPWDIINVHTGRSHTWSVLSNFLTRRKVVIVRTRGDARPVQSNFLSRFNLHRTDAIISASEHIRHQFEEVFGADDKRLSTIYPSVQCEQVVTAPSGTVVGTLGRLDPVKGHSTLLEAAAIILKKFPRVEFWIAGREANITVQILENQAEQLGISQSVKFLGFQENARDFMKKCNIGVIASIGSEEISRACLEWMSVGRPVVGTLVGCLSELIEPSETGLLVPPGDSVALANAINTLLESTDLQNRWGKNGLEKASRKYSESTQYKETMQVYEEALRRKI